MGWWSPLLLLFDMPGGMPVISDNLSTYSLNDEALLKKQICGVAARRILALNRDDVYEARSPILFHVAELPAKFKKKMGREFCLNAAATKVCCVSSSKTRNE